jgi:hypothetical protein
MTVETIAAAGYGVGAITLLLAEATGVIPTLDGFDVTQISSIGFAIWYGWYTTSRAIPRIIDQHALQLQAADSRHRESLSMAATAFREELASIRQERERDREHFQCEKDKR